MVTFLFIYFILDLHATKNITMLYCAVFRYKHHSVKYRELSLKPEAVQTIFQHVLQPIKRTVKSEHEEDSKQ